MQSTPKMSTMAAQYRLRSGVPSDIEDMADTFLDAFSGNTVGRTFFPRSSPSARSFWLDALTEEIYDKNARFLVVEDTSTSPATFIGFAKWNTPAASQGPSTPLPDSWPEDGDPALASVFFQKLADMHGMIMGKRLHWYLEIIVTRTEFQGKGAGAMMMQWGVTKADEDKIECYLDATPEGKPLYEKFGFRDELVWPFFDSEYRHSFMVRQSVTSKKD